ncbi:MAG: hypothetical protein GY797_17575 [Deltaproteobacteria bacterium]|nr:hypothetical protein [Deltaproteobacteria bacterium]
MYLIEKGHNVTIWDDAIKMLTPEETLNIGLVDFVIKKAYEAYKQKEDG